MQITPINLRKQVEGKMKKLGSVDKWGSWRKKRWRKRANFLIFARAGYRVVRIQTFGTLSNRQYLMYPITNKLTVLSNEILQLIDLSNKKCQNRDGSFVKFGNVHWLATFSNFAIYHSGHPSAQHSSSTMADEKLRTFSAAISWLLVVYWLCSLHCCLGLQAQVKFAA